MTSEPFLASAMSFLSRSTAAAASGLRAGASFWAWATLGLAGVRTGAWAWTTETAAAVVTARTASQARTGLTADDNAASRNQRIQNLVDAGTPGVSGRRGAVKPGK